MAALPYLDQAPKDVGTLEMVVARPSLGERGILTEGELSVEVGLVGDTWQHRPSRRTADGSPHPHMKLNVMSWRMVCLLADNDEQRALAGDQLYVDLDLSHENLPTGSRLVIGDADERGAVIEVTAQPHTGCAKFISRFGVDAQAFANGGEGRPRRLRGLNAVVLTPGLVRPGDAVRVVRP